MADVTITNEMLELLGVDPGEFKTAQRLGASIQDAVAAKGMGLTIPDYLLFRSEQGQEDLAKIVAVKRTGREEREFASTRDELTKYLDTEAKPELAKLNDFSDGESIVIRKGSVSFPDVVPADVPALFNVVTKMLEVRDKMPDSFRVVANKASGTPTFDFLNRPEFVTRRKRGEGSTDGTDRVRFKIEPGQTVMVKLHNKDGWSAPFTQLEQIAHSAELAEWSTDARIASYFKHGDKCKHTATEGAFHHYCGRITDTKERSGSQIAQGLYSITLKAPEILKVVSNATQQAA